jgi:uncharacterized protein YecE (DUF72 family)
MLRVGTAGWSIPRGASSQFDSSGSHLERYARLMPAAEINSSFYRSHARSTYERWAASTPSHFRFSVKVPRVITHEQRLCDSDDAFRRFLDETEGLGERRGPVLVQLPPSFAFDRRVARRFFDMVRDRYAGPLTCEPRHATWFTRQATALFLDHRVARVAADPPRHPDGAEPAGWTGLTYVRWHGHPRVYWSSYDDQSLRRLAERLRDSASHADVWCIFDNTASGAAILNARQVLRAGRVDPGQDAGEHAKQQA